MAPAWCPDFDASYYPKGRNYKIVNKPILKYNDIAPRGEVIEEMEKMMTKIIEVAVGLLLVAVLVPLGLITLAGQGANMTAAGVDPTVAIVLLVLLPILAIIGLALYFIPKYKQ